MQAPDRTGLDRTGQDWTWLAGMNTGRGRDRRVAGLMLDARCWTGLAHGLGEIVGHWVCKAER
eukprot:2864016-Alexandrium_andersonii.AAC.1